MTAQLPAVPAESDTIALFRAWFRNNGGRIHDDLYFSSDSSGLAVRTRRSLQSGVFAAACAFSLAITVESTREALKEYCRLSPEEQLNLSYRQLICAYIGLHYVIGEAEDEKCLLRHRPYLSLLPKAGNLLTPLYFTDSELGLFKGTNLYGAAIDQRNTCMDEYRQLVGAISEHSPSISDRFTLDMYKLATTYLLSRAFPSTLLSNTPSLVVTPSSYPILLPGVDSFNHKRGQPVSWTITRTGISSANSSRHTGGEPNQQQSDLSVALVIETPTHKGEEVFNNYGPKPNSSFILGYGFALPDNPDDTILLKVGSIADGSRSGDAVGYEVGRNARDAEAIWNDVRRIIASQYGDETRFDDGEAYVAREIQIDMETAGTLSGMVSSLISRLPDLTAEHAPPLVRREVHTMWRYYVQGQRDILGSLLEWLEGKDREAVRRAEELGISMVGTDSEEE